MSEIFLFEIAFIKKLFKHMPHAAFEEYISIKINAEVL